MKRLINILLVFGVLLTLFAGCVKTKEPDENPTEKVTEAPQLREELTEVNVEDDSFIPVDIENYITYDYSAIVDKEKEPLFKSSYMTELLKSPSKHSSCVVPKETMDSFKEYYTSLPATQQTVPLEEAMRQEVFHEVPIEFNIEGFDDSELTILELQRTTHTMYSNECHVAFYKEAFDNYKDYYKVSYDLFMEVIKSIDPEVLKANMLIQKPGTTYDSLLEKVDEKDYDNLFNSMMNNCWQFNYTDEEGQISFGIQYSGDYYDKELFFVNVIYNFEPAPIS